MAHRLTERRDVAGEGRPEYGIAEGAADPRDLEIERLRRECDELRARERAAHAEIEQLHDRFTLLTSASKRFAASMRGGMNERSRYRRRLATQYSLSRILEWASDMDEAAPDILRIIAEHLGGDAGVFWKVEGAALRCAAVWSARDSTTDSVERAYRRRGFARGEGLPGRAWARGELVFAGDTGEEDESSLAALAGEGLGEALAFPVKNGGLIGVLAFFRHEPFSPDDDLPETVSLIGSQIGQFVERRRAEEERDRALLRERGARQKVTDILESINDAFFALDRERRFTYVNHKAEQLLGETRSELVGNSFREVLRALPRAAGSELYGKLERALDETVPTGFEEIWPPSQTWISARVYPSAGGVSVSLQDIEARKKAEEERERLLARELIARSQAEERRRISRELHDRVAHDIALVHQSLELHEALRESAPEKAARKLELARETARGALDSTRNLSMELRHPEVRRGLEAALSDLLRDLVPPDVRADLAVRGDETTLAPEARNHVFLVLREAIRNAVAHSDCASIRVELDVTPGGLVGVVEDDGKGFSAAAARPSGSSGLRSMEERASLVNGVLSVTSVPGAGTRVELRASPQRTPEGS